MSHEDRPTATHDELGGIKAKPRPAGDRRFPRLRVRARRTLMWTTLIGIIGTCAWFVPHEMDRRSVVARTLKIPALTVAADPIPFIAAGDGVVVAVHVVPGDMVDKGTPLLEVRYDATDRNPGRSVTIVATSQLVVTDLTVIAGETLTAEESLAVGYDPMQVILFAPVDFSDASNLDGKYVEVMIPSLDPFFAKADGLRATFYDPNLNNNARQPQMVLHPVDPMWLNDAEVVPGLAIPARIRHEIPQPEAKKIVDKIIEERAVAGN